ncbi:MAG: Xaa-Pro dipeptidyl-peptidase [Planctomycetes bacterium]|nr:Xaa-Pro dipeptidyl-peptidase [Planctomycetota bacterium]
MNRRRYRRNISFPRVLCTVCAIVLAAAASREAFSQVATDKAAPVFANGEAQVVEAFQNPKDWIREDLWVETEFDSDGDGKRDRVHVDVTRQGQTETEGLKVPVIYETSPYYNGVAGNNPAFFWNPKHAVGAKPPVREHPPGIRARTPRPMMSQSLVRTWVPRGFAVVHSASPGTGLSQGCPTVGGDNESLAPKAVIDWLCGRAKGFSEPHGGELLVASWCTGKVGMTGTSYNGTLPLAAATTGVEGLEAIIPVAPNTSYYHYYRANGLVRHPGGYMGEDIDVLYDFIHSGDVDRREWCNCNVRDAVLAKNLDRVTGDYSDFWAGRDYGNKLGAVRAAVLMAHGLNDWNVMPSHTIRIYAALKAMGLPTQIYLHQGGHGGPPPMAMMNRWFSRYLYGVENGVEKDPRAMIVRVGERSPTAYPDYPNPEAQPVVLHPTRGGSDQGGLAASADEGQGVESLSDNVELTGAQLAQASLPHRLVYATAPLTSALHLSGTPEIHLRVACDKKAANLSVWLVQLPWKKGGRVFDNVITRGWADPQNHVSLRKGEPLEPGKFYDLKFALEPDDQVVPEGRSIGLMLFSSDRDFTLWPPPGTELKFDLDACSLTLPVIGGAEAFRAATK